MMVPAPLSCTYPEYFSNHDIVHSQVKFVHFYYQAHDRSSGQAKESIDAQIHKEYEEARQYLVSELAKVKASLLGMFPESSLIPLFQLTTL